MNAAAHRLGVFGLIVVLVFPLVLGLGMLRNLDHDEHQHLAAGALLAREGKVPYRDFPHFHTPYLALVYGALFRTTDRLLLAARLFSVGCATAMLGLLGTAVWALFRERVPGRALPAALLAVTLALATSLFAHTTGRAWNQEPALLFAFLAFLVHAHAASRRWLWGIGLSGLLLGVAIGFRITYAPLLAPFGIALWFGGFAPSKWLGPAVCFGAGLAIGLSGLIYFFAIAPEQTWFGNFEFARMNVTYRLATGEPRTMTLPKKLRFFFKEVVRPDWPLFVGFVGSLGGTRRAWRSWPFALRFLLLTLPFLLYGSIAPSPVFDQYFYPFVPFLILGAALALREIPHGSVWFPRAGWFAVVMTLVAVGLGARAYRRLHDLPKVADWAPMELHEEARQLHALLPPGRVLTLAPERVIEGGGTIYPAFGTGPFAWRISGFVEPARAARLGLITPQTLTAALEADPPAAIILGDEPRWEQPLTDYAAAHGYVRTPWENGKRALWLRP